MSAAAAALGDSRIPTAQIGGTELRVARLGLGTVPLGNMLGAIDDEAASSIVRRAADLGLQMIDTAPQYGSGLAERRIGDALRQVDSSSMVIATKVGRLLARSSTGGKVARIVKEAARTGDLGLVWRNASGVVRRLAGRDSAFPLGFPLERGERALESYFDFSYDAAMRSVEESLARLGVDRVDILYIHDPDNHFTEALAGAYRALAQLRSEGTIRAVGVGMNHSEPLAAWVREADLDCVLLAGRYTLLDQSGMADLLPIAAARGVTVNVGGVFNSGILADPRPGASYNYEPIDQASPVLQRALKLKQLCERHEVPLAAAAIQFPTAHPAVGVVLAGIRSVEELEMNVRLFTQPIPEGLWEEIRAEGLVGDEVPLPAIAHPTSPGA